MTPGSMPYCRVVQKIEGSVLANYNGKITLSTLVSSVTANAFYIEISYFDSNNTQKYTGYKLITGIGVVSTTVNIPSDADFTKPFWIMVSQANTASGSVTIKAVKLELGSGQTLAHQENGVWVLNEIPNYAEELAKCQRYCLVLGGTTFGRVGVGPAANNTTAFISVPLPVSLANGTKTAYWSGNWQLSNTVQFPTVASIRADVESANNINLYVTVTDGLVAGNFYALQADNDTSARIIISVDL